ncbi:dynein regulatory complex protein 8-like [Bolinopsis microptera]|uniref:dynein regulatory complex protein 8-like n=1 Tax=Bolinopsis microptera TaxID=2820187 RepID=UPI00307AF2B7
MATNGDGGKVEDPALLEMQKLVKDAFSIFDHENNDTVDMREVGTIIRSLGCFPTEGELNDMIAEVEEDEPTGYVRYERFEPMMTRVLMDKSRYRPEPEDRIIKAFEVLDKELKGYLTPEELQRYMTTEGEAFTTEEMDEMLSAAIDQDKQLIYYKDFAPLMLLEES